MTTIIIQIIIVVIFSAFFSGMEIAFVASNRFRMEIDMNNNTITSRILDRFYRNSNNYISSMLVGNNIVLVIYGILMANLLNHTILATLNDTPSAQLTLQTIISTIIIIITGEFIPKTLFRINPNSTIKSLAIPAFLFYVILYPLAQFTMDIMPDTAHVQCKNKQGDTRHHIQQNGVDTSHPKFHRKRKG